MHPLLSRHKLPKPLHNKALRLEFELHAAPDEALDNFRSVVQNERHYSLLVEISGKEGVKTVVNGELAHIYQDGWSLEQQGALMVS